jgi:cytochrome P450
VVLIGLFSELARKPECAEDIYEELQDVDINNTKILAKLPCLNAAITEALRLYPILPTGGSRKTGKNGLMIGNVFIPPETIVIGPRFTIQRRKLTIPHVSLLHGPCGLINHARGGLFHTCQRVHT